MQLRSASTRGRDGQEDDGLVLQHGQFICFVSDISPWSSCHDDRRALAVRDKLLFLENPRNRHLPFRAAAPVDPSALVSYEKVLAFDRLGLPEPRRLKHMRDDAVKAAAHRAHDEGETKEIEEVKHRIFHSQKVEEAEFVLHATKEMKAGFATLHKHEDNERKENAKFRAGAGPARSGGARH